MAQFTRRRAAKHVVISLSLLGVSCFVTGYIWSVRTDAKRRIEMRGLGIEELELRAQGSTAAAGTAGEAVMNFFHAMGVKDTRPVIAREELKRRGF